VWFLVFFFRALDPGFVQLANFVELDAQTMSQGTFCAKLVEQRFRLLKGVRGNVFGFKEIAKAALNLGFGKQDFLL
jgi:hypothetical protein